LESNVSDNNSELLLVYEKENDVTKRAIEITDEYVDTHRSNMEKFHTLVPECLDTKSQKKNLDKVGSVLKGFRQLFGYNSDDPLLIENRLDNARSMREYRIKRAQEITQTRGMSM